MTTTDGTTEIFSAQEMRWLVVEKFVHMGVSYYYSPAILGGGVDDGEILYDAETGECDSTLPNHRAVGVWDGTLKKVVDYDRYRAAYYSCMDDITA